MGDRETAAVPFVTKSSGKKAEFAGGMVRDVSDGKTRFNLCLDGPMLDRWAQALERGAEKYEPRNWMLANDEAAMVRYEQSALTHMIQYLRGDRDEDHAAAVFFNLNGAEYVRERMAERASLVAKMNQVIPL